MKSTSCTTSPRLPHALRRIAVASILSLLAIGSTQIVCAAEEAESGNLVKDGVILPNPHLSAQNIPAIEQSMADKIQPYLEFRQRKVLDWHPQKRALLLSTRSKGGTNQLHLLSAPMAEMEQITQFDDPVKQASFQPIHGKFLIFEKDTGGNEANQVYRMDLPSRKITQLTDPAEKHSAGAWDHRGKRIVLSSVQLDKTAKGNSRANVTTNIALLDPLHPEAKKTLGSLPGGGWDDFQWSPDDKHLLAINRKSANEAVVWLISTSTGEVKQILPAADNNKQISFSDPQFSRDGKSILLSSDEEGEFLQLTQIRLSDLQRKVLSKHIAWDVTANVANDKNDLLASVINRDGLSELHLFDVKTGKELAQPKLPSGAVSHLNWRNGTELAFDLNSSQSPGEIYSLNLKSGKVEQWTKPAGGVDSSAFRSAEIIRWKSFDGKQISGLISRPPAQNSRGEKFTGPRPVLIGIHGGPEAQAQIGYLGRINYLVNELGITYIQPNVRGSSGYGKSFLKLDNGMLREDSVKDIGALLDWIGTQSDLDAKHVAVAGGSYGGYMSLAVSTTYADRIVGAVDTVGISHFVSFLERTESYRRDLRRVEYGDERDPAMRAFLEKIAPLNNAHKITKPLFVVQGKNDPRVPLNEAEQIVARVKQNNVPIWYLLADNEGHGFARKPNVDFLFYSYVRFLQEYLLK